MNSASQELGEKRHIICVVFGPSQYGKSTFINNILKYAGSMEEAKVGTGRGESVTIDVHTYNVQIIPEMFPSARIGYDTFQLIDVPGILDSGLRITKEEIFTEIKAVLLRNGIQKINCFLVFESMKDDSRKINISMQSIIEVFGDNIRQSVLVLTTKWDRVDEDEREGLIDYLDSLILPLGIRHMEWQNNIKVRNRYLLTDEEVKQNLSKLGANISKCTPYYVTEMENILRRRNELAERIRENDPDRYAKEQQEVEIDVPDVQTSFHEIDITVFEPYTPQEIEEKAKIMMENDPGDDEIHYEMQETVEYHQEPRTVYEGKVTGLIFKEVLQIPKTIMVDVPTKVKKPVPVSTTKKKRDINYYKKFYESGGKPVLKKQRIPTQKVEMKKGKKIIEAQHEKHDLEHYIELAARQIENEIRESIRKRLH
jgi:GTP-binding protein EngB required for normal cell division